MSHELIIDSSAGDAFEGIPLRLPWAASLDPDEVGVIRDAEGRAVCDVDVERERSDIDVARLVWLICTSANRLQPRAPAALAEGAWTALETIRAVLAPVGEASEPAMAALQVAEDALAELWGAAPQPRAPGTPSTGEPCDAPRPR